MTKIQELCRAVGAEGIVLLKNEKQALPIRSGETVSVFGRSQLNYYKSGTGSGGLVNVDYVVDIPQGLREAEGITLNEELYQAYLDWEKENPYDTGNGWAQEPFSQKEMPVSDFLAAEAAAHSDLALVLIGRLAGEDRDSDPEKGSFYLADQELELLKTVRAHFSRVVVALNVGNLLDMSWDPLCDAVLYLWQGGQEGGRSAADVLTGKVCPSGRLSDTISLRLEDVPSVKNFGGPASNSYEEDIYVGYRWFETFAPERVKYPFGFGLSYTSFSWDTLSIQETEQEVAFRFSVENTGAVPGKEVLQLYAGLPQGKLGQPKKALCGFAKTNTLSPGEKQEIAITVSKEALASYDDSGATGHKACRVLEAGDYLFYAGTDVRAAQEVYRFSLPETMVVETLQECMAPFIPMRRVKPQWKDGVMAPALENVPLRTCDPMARRLANLPKEIPYQGDQGITLLDVQKGSYTLDEFIAQLSDEDLACLTRGEGMSSPKATWGVASVFGGVTPSLAKFGIPVAGCSDGPSGIRMDCGTHATSLPSGTLLACTFNEALNQELFTEMGKELRKHKIDTLLGPGINIHRCPLNGRNFEYFSEDPLLTGKMAAAQLKGMHRHGVTGTIKHFCANNQEYRRNFISSDVSERALRDIYLKGFEIAVKEGGARLIMTTYGAVNRIWTAGNYDLCTTILRKEWGFQGAVMTDWWAMINDEGDKACMQNTKAMIRAQNDLYMVTMDSQANTAGDNTLEALADGGLTRGELQRSARNICGALLASPCMERVYATENGAAFDVPPPETIEFVIRDGAELEIQGLPGKRGASRTYTVFVEKNGFYQVTAVAASSVKGRDKMPATVAMRNCCVPNSGVDLIFTGTNGLPEERSGPVLVGPGKNYLHVSLAQDGLELQRLRFRFLKGARKNFFEPDEQ